MPIFGAAYAAPYKGTTILYWFKSLSTMLSTTVNSFVCLIWFLTSHQQSFSYIGTGLPGLNQYQARINVSCSRTTTQWRRWGSNPRPFGLESSTLPLSSLQKIVKFMVFSRLLSDFPVHFKADLIFKDFSRKPSKFKYFSSLCEPCTH